MTKTAKKAKAAYPKYPFSFKRLGNQMASVFGNPFNVIVFITLVMLFFLIVVPLLTMLKNTVTVANADRGVKIFKEAGLKAGEFTMLYWKLVLNSANTVNYFTTPLLNSLLIGTCVTIISVPLGAVMAWLIVRTDLPGKKLISSLVLVPYMIPSWCKALCWLSIFRNNTSGQLGFLSGMGINIPDWLAYGPVAIILVMCLHYYAFSYIMVSGALRSINSELEEMGEIQGATKAQILKNITLPLVLPSILSAAIMTISKSLGTYGVAARLGGYVKFYVLATRMKEFFGGATYQPAGFVLSIMMIGLAAATVMINQKLIGTRKSYATIGGKGTRSNLIKLGGARIPMTAFLVLFLILAMVFPLLVLIGESFQIIPGKGYGLDNLSLYAWIGKLENAPTAAYNMDGLFMNKEFKRALWNTFKLSILGSAITAFCGLFLGYITTRGRGKWFGKMTEQLIFIPYLMPGVAFSAIYLSMFARPSLGGLIPSLYGTFALILLVSIVKHFPFASRSGSSNMMQIAVELEEAATINGAGFWKRIFSVVMPLAKNGFFAGFLLSFISIAKELDLIAILMNTENKTLSFLSFDYSAEGTPQVADAICIVIIVFVLVFNKLAKLLGGEATKSM